MTYLIIANWDASFRPDRVNWKDTEGEAQALVDLLISKGDTDAFYIPTPRDDIMHVRVNPSNKSVTVDASEASSKAFVALRRERDNLLHDTDWWASSDLSITEAQTTYRQALRDLPANTADAANPVWPVAPGA